MPSLNATGKTTADAHDVAAFEGVPSFSTLSGPLTLYRFGQPDGRWWYDHTILAEIKEDYLDLTYGKGPRSAVGYGNILLSQRDGLAVSHEWNNFSWICKLRLPPNATLDCWIGEAARQPTWQSKKDGAMLRGGAKQYLIYDLATIPAGMIIKLPVWQVWKLWSQNLNSF